MVITETQLPDLKPYNRGKVRDIYELDDGLLIVATDRISAFDCILPNGIPHKGAVLTQISAFWFQMLTDIIPNHMISTDLTDLPRELQDQADVLDKRFMLVQRARVLPIECVVRGYLAGSGWKEYQQSGTICGISIPPGLEQAAKLPELIFTPATKAESGHDINITLEQTVEIVGEEHTKRIREVSLALYTRAAEYARECGLILSDTKFEFGISKGELILVDEALTPDSSRYWAAEDYRTGTSPNSFDKQYVRDWLETCDWDKTPPAPELPPDVVENTSLKYQEAYRRLTGKDLLED